MLSINVISGILEAFEGDVETGTVSRRISLRGG
jgi:hypothetical protein